MAAPSVVGTASLDGQTVAIRFAAALDEATASEIARYSIAGATVQAANMPDDKTVLLTVAGLAGGSYTVSGTGVKDALGEAGNFTSSGSILDFEVQDIGPLADPSFGYAYTTSSIAMKLNGGFIWGVADTAKYIYQPRTGDFDVRVRVARADGGNANSNIALDARESLDPGSRHVAITVYPPMANWTAFVRDATGGETSVLQGNWRTSWPPGSAYPNIWLRIKCVGNTFTTYGSIDGISWTQVGDAYTAATPYATKYIGMTGAITDSGVPPLNAEFADFGEYAFGNASVVIDEQPQPMTVTENQSVSFSVSATLVNGPASALEYQWLSNGVPVAQAINSSYVVPSPKLANSGDQYRVVVGAPGVLSVTSSVAVLTVQADTVAPYALSAGGISGRTIAVKFNEVMDPNTATDPSHYSLGGPATVDSAILLNDKQTLVLRVPLLSGTSFALQMTGVKDLAGNAVSATVNGPILNFTAQDLGYFDSNSFVYADGPSHVVTVVQGGEIWGQFDTASYLYQTRTNDFDVRVRIDRFQGSFNGNVALDVRESTEQGSRHVAVTVYPTQGRWAAFARDLAWGDTAVLPGNWWVGFPAGSGYPNIWLRIRRSLDTFTAFGSTNGLDWIQVGNAYTPSTPFAATMLAGIAAATTDTGVAPQVFEFSNFGEFSISGASIQINEEPVDLPVEEHHPATFTIGAELLNGPSGVLAYQWQRNGLDIPGANSATYTMQNPTLLNHGDQVRVRLSAPGLESVFSRTATLTVLADTTPPAMVMAGG